MKATTNYTVLFLVALLVIYIALLDTLAKPLFESQASEMYGAEVTISSLKVSPFAGKVTLYDLQVADRRNPMRNLAQADRAYIDISILKLAEDIIDIEELQVDGLLTLSQRERPADILRPLLEEDDPIELAGLPNFQIPDVDALVTRQRGKFEADIDKLEQAFRGKESKWHRQMDTMPSAQDLAHYRKRIDELRKRGGADGKQAAAAELRTIFSELRGDINTLTGMQAEFRGDLQMLREAVDQAAKLPDRHTNELLSSLGLNAEQTAQLGSRLLGGDFDGLLQQVLAPLAFNQAGVAASNERSMPIYIQKASIEGQLLPSAAGLTTNGELTEFAWPLELADAPTLFKLTGKAQGGGDILIDAVIDHRDVASDLVKVAIDRLPLREMELAGNPELDIVMEQVLASVNGELQLQGEVLSGGFTQNFTDAVFQTELADGAGDASRLIAEMLRTTRKFMLQVGLSGTVFEPQLSFDSDLDRLFEETLRNALSQTIGDLTRDLKNRISSEVGPEIAAAREKFASMEMLERELQETLGELSGMSP